jgi:hypothetical protein
VIMLTAAAAADGGTRPAVRRASGAAAPETGKGQQNRTAELMPIPGVAEASMSPAALGRAVMLSFAVTPASCSGSHED